MSVGAVNKQTGDRIPTAGMPAIDAALSGSSTNPVQNRVVKAAFDAIKDGQSIDSFADVETALAGKQGTLTFDDTPTDGSNNPVKSNGIYDALATKANTDMVAADFNAGTSYTAGNYCVQDGKLYRFKNNHSGAWSASDVEEVKIAGELSSLKSGLTDYVKIGIAYLAEDVTVPVGLFDLQFPVPAIDGYKSIGVTTYNFADRGIAADVHISGVDRSASVVHIYGSVSQQVTFRTAAYVCILYIRV